MDVSSKKFTLVEREHFTVDLEYNKDFAILHLPRVDKMNRSLLEYMIMHIDSLAEFLYGLGYEDMYGGAPTEYKTVHRLMEKVGFKHIGTKDNIEVFIYAGEPD